MNLKKGLGAVVASGLVITACTTWNKNASNEAPDSGNREIAGFQGKNWGKAPARPFSSGDLQKISTTGPFALNEKSYIITDNNQAFQSKLGMINSAKYELDLVYYIYAEDFSSSTFSAALIDAAQRGVKVRLLVDFLTNYDHMDLFRYLQNAGSQGSKGGFIEVRFFGMPSLAVRQGAVYMTYPCSKEKAKSPDQCQADKMARWQADGQPLSTWFSKMYLAGLYSKNQTLLETAVGLGGQFDPKAMKSAGPSTPEQKKQLAEFGKLVVKAKMSSDISSKIKLAVALQTYSETLNPIMNEITGRLPLVNGGGPEWNHLTDYTHHKLIVADGNKFQLGGRNIEDSYHTDNVKQAIPDAQPKYTFIDTDFYAETASAGNISSSFKRLFGHADRTGGIVDVDNYLPNEYDVNAEAFKMSLGTCLQDPNLQATPQGLESCVNSKITSMPGYRDLKTRLNDVYENMTAKKEAYARAKDALKTNNGWKANGSAINPADIGQGQAFYIENLLNRKENPNERLFGSKIGQEAQHGKYIHAAWIRGLENVCAVATPQNPKRVVLHQAYFLAPSGLIAALANMTNGTWNCRNVDIVILTNSMQSTDLNVINVFARYQLGALFTEHRLNQNPNKAKIRYFEYLAAKGTEGPVTKKDKPPGVSLHTKVSVMGDDMIIGSANADVRSYFMDTNNGIYLRNYKNTIAEYNKYIDGLLADRTKTVERTQEYTNIDLKKLAAENGQIIQGMAYYYGKSYKDSAVGSAKERIGMLGTKIYIDTKKIINAQATIDTNMSANASYNDAAVGNVPSSEMNSPEMDKLANDFDQTWKVL